MKISCFLLCLGTYLALSFVSMALRAQAISGAPFSGGVGYFAFDPPPPAAPEDLLLPTAWRKTLFSAKRNELGTDLDLASREGPRHDYVDLKTLIVIYTAYRKHASDPELTAEVAAEDIDILRSEVLKAREFIWRNSYLKVNTRLEYLVVHRELTLDQFWRISEGRYWLPYWSIDGAHSVVGDLIDNGKLDSYYDCIVTFYAWQGTEGAGAAYGGATYGVGISALMGAAYVAIPMAWDIHSKHGTFIHEYLHVIDSIFEKSGDPGFPSADHPQEHDGDYNFGGDWNAWMLRTWPVEKWFAMTEWGEIRQTPDSDNDGVPDSGVDGAGSELPISEDAVGSDPSLTDTDGDRLPDLAEVMAGLYFGANPLLSDTDGDGLIDGDDPYPLFRAQPRRHFSRAVVDGVIEENEHDFLTAFGSPERPGPSGDVYLDWDDHFLYISAVIVDETLGGGFAAPWWNDGLVIQIDANNDGFRWHGDDNYEIYVGPQGQSPERQPFWHARIFNADGAVDEDIVPDEDMVAAVVTEGNTYTLELAVPANPALGLNLAAGYTCGIHLEVIDFQPQASSWDRYDVISDPEKPTTAWMDVTLAPAEVLVVDPPTVDFLDVRAGDSSDRFVKLTNEGTREIAIGAITNPTTPFTITADNCCARSITPGNSCQIRVRFSPASAGTFNSSFDIPYNDFGEKLVTVPLSGNAAYTPMPAFDVLKAKVSQNKKRPGQEAKISCGFQMSSDKDISEGLRITIGSYEKELTQADLIDKKGTSWQYKRPKGEPKGGIKKLKIKWDKKGNVDRDAVKVSIYIDDAPIFPEGIPDGSPVNVNISIRHGFEQGAETIEMTQKKPDKLSYKARK